MSRNVVINFSASSLDYARLALQDVKNGISRATKNATNSTIAGVRKEIYQSIRDKYALRTAKKTENAATEVTRAKNEPYAGKIHYKDTALSLMKFKILPSKQISQRGKRINQRKRVTSEIVRGNPNKWSHAFIATMGNGIGIFTRRGKYNNRRYWNVKTKERKKVVKGKEMIEKRYTTSIPQMVDALLEYDKGLQARINAIADIQLNIQVKKLLAKG